MTQVVKSVMQNQEFTTILLIKFKISNIFLHELMIFDTVVRIFKCYKIELL